MRSITIAIVLLAACGDRSATPPRDPANRDTTEAPATSASASDPRVELARRLLAGEKPGPNGKLTTVLPSALGPMEAAVVDAVADLAPLLARVGFPHLHHPALDAAAIQGWRHDDYALGQVDLGPSRVTILFSIDSASPEPLVAAVYRHDQEVLPLVDADDVQVCIRYTRTGHADEESVCRAR